MQHRHEAHNNWDTEFDFTDANYEKVRCLGPCGMAGREGEGAGGGPGRRRT